MTKILLIRFSAIGDLVLTSALIRCIKEQVPDAEIHFLTKKKYEQAISNNPHISELHLFENNFWPIIQKLRSEHFDYVVDLHSNQRSALISLLLFTKTGRLKKYYWRRWLLEKFKSKTGKLPHVVERYFDAAQLLNIKYDGKGLDFFINENEDVPIDTLPENFTKGYVAFSIGGSFTTKRLPKDKILAICKQLNYPVILLGGQDSFDVGEYVKNNVNQSVINTCGKYTLAQSASLVKQAVFVITHDTALMHIGAAFNKPILSVWGNSVKEFGMTPFFPSHLPSPSLFAEVNNLPCRPCSRLGFDKCPKGHFHCMEKQNTEEITRNISHYLVQN